MISTAKGRLPDAEPIERPGTKPSISLTFEVSVAEMNHLYPRVLLAGAIGCVDALGDDPLEVLRGDRIEQRLAVRLDVLD